MVIEPNLLSLSKLQVWHFCTCCLNIRVWKASGSHEGGQSNAKGMCCYLPVTDVLTKKAFNVCIEPCIPIRIGSITCSSPESSWASTSRFSNQMPVPEQGLYWAEIGVSLKHLYPNTPEVSPALQGYVYTWQCTLDYSYVYLLSFVDLSKIFIILTFFPSIFLFKITRSFFKSVLRGSTVLAVLLRASPILRPPQKQSVATLQTRALCKGVKVVSLCNFLRNSLITSIVTGSLLGRPRAVSSSQFSRPLNTMFVREVRNTGTGHPSAKWMNLQ